MKLTLTYIAVANKMRLPISLSYLDLSSWPENNVALQLAMSEIGVDGRLVRLTVREGFEYDRNFRKACALYERFKVLDNICVSHLKEILNSSIRPFNCPIETYSEVYLIRIHLLLHYKWALYNNSFIDLRTESPKAVRDFMQTVANELYKEEKSYVPVKVELDAKALCEYCSRYR
jgi:hypothetical protein